MQPPGQPEALREDVSRVVQARGQLVEHGGEQAEGVVHGGAEELLLAVEVVVERSQAHVRGLGDLQDRDVGRPGGEEGLGRADQRGAGVRLAPVQAAGCLAGVLGHDAPLFPAGLA